METECIGGRSKDSATRPHLRTTADRRRQPSLLYGQRWESRLPDGFPQLEQSARYRSPFQERGWQDDRARYGACTKVRFFGLFALSHEGKPQLDSPLDNGKCRVVAGTG